VSVLFTNDAQVIQVGVRESAPVAVPDGVKQPGLPLSVRITLGAEAFPNGTTTLTVFLSLDGGATFPRSASMTVVMPVVFRGPAPHFWFMGFSLGPNDNPTHVKFSTNVPTQFTTSVLLEAE